MAALCVCVSNPLHNLRVSAFFCDRETFLRFLAKQRRPGFGFRPGLLHSRPDASAFLLVEKRWTNKNTASRQAEAVSQINAVIKGTSRGRRLCCLKRIANQLGHFVEHLRLVNGQFAQRLPIQRQIRQIQAVDKP